jgi:DNA-binding CsgD family transcriptional regulator
MSLDGFVTADGITDEMRTRIFFVTRKTVETHIGHVSRKLGISGREALRVARAEQPAARR